MADTRTTVVTRLKTNLDTWLTAAPGGFGNDGAITTIVDGDLSDADLTAYEELLAELLDDTITVISNQLSDFQTILKAKGQDSYARSIGYFDTIVDSMVVILRPIIRAVT
jgi:hypothetical protein